MCKITKKYTISKFREEYPDEKACLDKVFKLTYGNSFMCPKCNRTTTYRRITTRRCYQCPKCYNQIYPTVGTIFEKSSTPLMYWFYAIFLFSVSKNGISAMELTRQLGVSYKTAWRMLKQIRLLLKQEETLFSGIVELDETYIGGKNKNRHYNKKVKNSQGRSYKDKTPVFGILQRGGNVAAYVVPSVKSTALKPIVYSTVEVGSTLMTDEWTSYNGLGRYYDHKVVHHGKGQYVNDDCYTNGLENFWSIVKRTINGSYIQVSPKYLQLYVDECVFRFNNRNNGGGIFNEVLNQISSSQPSLQFS